jgi:tRNA 2-thiouridine synthesizing protein A
MADKLVDARDLNCPLPILKATKALRSVAPGGTIELLATDPAAVRDVTALCESGRHTLVEQATTGGVYRFVIRRDV